MSIEAKTGLVVVASHYESGGQRAEELMEAAVQSMKDRMVVPAVGPKPYGMRQMPLMSAKSLKSRELIP